MNSVKVDIIFHRYFFENLLIFGPNIEISINMPSVRNCTSTENDLMSLWILYVVLEVV